MEKLPSDLIIHTEKEDIVAIRAGSEYPAEVEVIVPVNEEGKVRFYVVAGDKLCCKIISRVGAQEGSEDYIMHFYVDSNKDIRNEKLEIVTVQHPVSSRLMRSRLLLPISRLERGGQGAERLSSPT